MNAIIVKFPLEQEHLDALRRIAAIRDCTTGDVIRAAIMSELFFTDQAMDNNEVMLRNKRSGEISVLDHDWT